ncbi:hypothetical protein BHM03_00014994 [Ensete ventricosum]|uniref:Uncharacterized protein n=1 Tax=Ensete ventricosum TaxID=4639 RepID=A0A445MEE8_ENSVE|nr:hypothetical protein BHM03_00014994 [Ensete ventricosum]
MHDVVGRRAISIKYCGSEKIARQQGRNHTRHARPRCGQPPTVPATLNTPIEDAAKTDGKGTANHRQTGIKATPGGLLGDSSHSHNTYKRKLRCGEGVGRSSLDEGLFLQVLDHGTRKEPLDDQNTSGPSRLLVSSPSSKSC